jgi:hypothetical protein
MTAMDLMMLVSGKSTAETGANAVVATLLATKTQILSAPKRSSPGEDTPGDSGQLALPAVAATKLDSLLTY